jgi:hypothetical protein
MPAFHDPNATVTAPRDVDAMEAWRQALAAEMRAWANAHGGEPPRAMDWNRAYARRHGARFEQGWPTSWMVHATTSNPIPADASRGERTDATDGRTGCEPVPENYGQPT